MVFRSSKTLLSDNETLPQRHSRRADCAAEVNTQATRPGGSGAVSKEAISHWSDRELLDMAKLLGVGRAEELSREALIDTLAFSQQRGRYR